MIIEDKYISSKSIRRHRHRRRQLALVPLHQYQHVFSHLLAQRVYVCTSLQQRLGNTDV